MPREQQDVEKMQEAEAQDPLFGGNVHPMEEKRTQCLCCTCTRKRLIIVLLICVMLLLYAIGLAIGLAVGLGNKTEAPPPPTKKPPLKIPAGAVVSQHQACSDIGSSMLERRGSVVDATIATLVCLGVRAPQSMGIGGGSFWVIYDKADKEAVYIDAREMAPERASDAILSTKEPRSVMVVYDKRSSKAISIDGMVMAPIKATVDTHTNGHPAGKIGIPGELWAYKRAHTLYGHLPWADLFEPTIKMLRDGYPISNTTAGLLQSTLDFYKLDSLNDKFPMLCKIFCAENDTSQPLKGGDIHHWPHLADTLQGVADQGPEYVYDGDVTQTLVDEIQEAGGVMTLMDFVSHYKLRQDDALSVELGNYTLYTMPGATGGPVLALILNIVKRIVLMWWGFDVDNISDQAVFYHSLIEAMKFAEADKYLLEDPDFNVEMEKLISKMCSEEYADVLTSMVTEETHEFDYYTSAARDFTENGGTAHVSVISPYGDAVSVTSTVNYGFGSKFASNSTGIIWNNELDDFSTTVEHNRIAPLKRPRSSMAPVIVVDREGNVRLVTGAAGGFKITNTVAQIVVKILLLDIPLETATDDKRISPKLSSNTVLYEEGFSTVLLDELKKRKHKIVQDGPRPFSAFSASHSVLVNSNNTVVAYSDKRKESGGTSYVYKEVPDKQ